MLVAFFTQWKLKVVYRNLYFWLIYFCLQIQGVTHLLLELLYCSPWLCFIYILQCHWFQPQAAGQSPVSPERAPPYFHNLTGVFTCQSWPWQQLTQMNHSPLDADAINITHILIYILDSEWCLMSAHRPNWAFQTHKEDVWWIHSLSFCCPLCKYDF